MEPAEPRPDAPASEEAHVAREIALEQDYADRLYARVDELMAQIQTSLDEVQGSQDAATHQNRSERDAFMALYEDRLALLRTVSSSVVFGRLDTDEGERHYIGRIGLFTPEREQLLVDWRAPAAAAYYQATSLERLGVRLRRHLISQGRAVVGLEDDVLDQSMLAQGAGGEEVVLQGEGALLAAVSSQRTGRMGDIVATIQAEQDRIIRSANRGVMVVQGGPGTGKTAVALHRAAYLLYTHRRRLEHSGVLIVAPTRGFLRYIERVLPSLGESGVVMSTPGGLFPGVETTLHDAPEVARLKGAGAIAELLSRAVKQRQLVPERDLELSIDGTPLRITRKILAEARREARSTHKPHNAARAVFVRAALDRLVQQYEAELSRRGTTVIPEDRPGYLDDLRRDPEVRRALNLAWLPYTPESFLRVLFAHPERLRAAAPRSLAGADLDLLVRSKDAPWTIEDVPLLDEVAELLGEDDQVQQADAERSRRRREADLDYAREVIENIDTSGIVRDEDLADRMDRASDGRTLAERAAEDRSWTYGHVVVDEAQELSAMMWRTLMRRCPSKSFTIVGDVAQTSSSAGTTSWERALAPYVEDRLEVEPLSVNYRTPRRIMDVAQAVAESRDLPITEVTSVREGDWLVLLHSADEAGLPDAVADAVAAQQAEAIGRLVVLTPGRLLEDVVRALRARDGLGRIGTGSRGIDDPIAVMTPQDAKGLEFDGVVLVEPAEILADSEGGAGDLYVAMTRATQRLDVVHARELPAGLTGAAVDSSPRT
ncbi:HelD family protein [Brachybacterium halotolerans]|uniref:HelD family protein n=1 Tax=Brachybacterium halotolerans TaxID=2795215 RepID=UPI0031B5A183